MAAAPNAVRELAEDATSRKKFLRQAGGAGIAGSLAAVIAACGGTDSSMKATPAATATPMASAKSGTEQFGAGDLGIANYALTLEYLEADFYAKVANSGMLKGKVADVARQFGDEEQQHVDALIQMIKQAGGTPATRPKTTFPLDDEQAILKLAATVENLGARAYLGQAPHIKDKEILAAALAIHSVEARHAAVLNLATNAKPAAGPFAQPVGADEVLKTVKPFLAT
jgi:rubrerythrin